MSHGHFRHIDLIDDDWMKILIQLGAAAVGLKIISIRSRRARDHFALAITRDISERMGLHRSARSHAELLKEVGFEANGSREKYKHSKEGAKYKYDEAVALHGGFG